MGEGDRGWGRSQIKILILYKSAILSSYSYMSKIDLSIDILI
jgi:hypothetical protein